MMFRVGTQTGIYAGDFRRFGEYLTQLTDDWQFNAPGEKPFCTYLWVSFLFVTCCFVNVTLCVGGRFNTTRLIMARACKRALQTLDRYVRVNNDAAVDSKRNSNVRRTHKTVASLYATRATTVAAMCFVPMERHAGAGRRWMAFDGERRWTRPARRAYASPIADLMRFGLADDVPLVRRDLPHLLVAV
jgi:hypothetical protein